MLAAAMRKCQCLGSVTIIQACCLAQVKFGSAFRACSLKNEPTSHRDLTIWGLPKAQITMTGGESLRFTIESLRNSGGLTRTSVLARFAPGLGSCWLTVMQ